MQVLGGDLRERGPERRARCETPRHVRSGRGGEFSLVLSERFEDDAFVVMMFSFGTTRVVGSFFTTLRKPNTNEPFKSLEDLREARASMSIAN